jgi:hypothetical protein
MRPSDDTTDPEAEAPTTADVGSEGGTPGDVEIARDEDPGVGSEASETWQPSGERERTIARDETGKGRRSP